MVGQSRNREKVRRFIKHRTIQETSYAASGRVSGLLDDYQLSPMHCCLSDATNEPLVTDFVLEVQPASSPTASEISQLTADSARPHAAAAGGGGGGKPPDSDSAIASRTPHKSPLHIGEAGKPTESAIARKHSPSASVFTRKLINSSSQLLFDKANKTSPSVVVPSTRPQTGGSVVRSATGAAAGGARVSLHHPSASRAMQLQVTKYNKLLRRRQEPLQSIIDTAVRTDNRSADDMMIGGSADDAVEVGDGGGEGIRSADDRMIGGSADDTVEVSDGELMTG